jgi:hypothetical protein
VHPKRNTTRKEQKEWIPEMKIFGIAVACTVELVQKLPPLLQKKYPYCTKKLPLLHIKYP